jgi:ribA/ribD-fused uncharacterized protein
MIKFYKTDDEYGWMSNFAKYSIKEGIIYYPTTEHYYQSKKTNNPDLELWIVSAPTPYAAMMAGRSLRPKEMKPNWDQIKFGVMLHAIMLKFTQHKDIREKLLATYDPIHEDSQDDMVWGIKGADMLGKLLMQVRDKLRQDS